MARSRILMAPLGLAVLGGWLGLTTPAAARPYTPDPGAATRVAALRTSTKIAVGVTFTFAVLGLVGFSRWSKRRAELAEAEEALERELRTLEYELLLEEPPSSDARRALNASDGRGVKD